MREAKSSLFPSPRSSRHNAFSPSFPLSSLSLSTWQNSFPASIWRPRMETKFSRLPPRRCLFLRHKLYFPLSPSPLLLFQFQNSLSLFPPISPDNGLLLIRHQRERRSLVFFPPSFSPSIPFPPFCHFSLTFFDQSPKHISSRCHVQLRKYRSHYGVLYCGAVMFQECCDFFFLGEFGATPSVQLASNCPLPLPPAHPSTLPMPICPSSSLAVHLRRKLFFPRRKEREREREGKSRPMGATDGKGKRIKCKNSAVPPRPHGSS